LLIQLPYEHDHNGPYFFWRYLITLVDIILQSCQAYWNVRLFTKRKDREESKVGEGQYYGCPHFYLDYNLEKKNRIFNMKAKHVQKK
jgi:hypothetical protein